MHIERPKFSKEIHQIKQTQPRRGHDDGLDLLIKEGTVADEV